MEMTQMNTRIPLSLKREGDEVLARYGKTSSDVMRSVWQYMVNHQRLPEYALDRSEPDVDAFAEKQRDIERGAALWADFHKALGLEGSAGASEDPAYTGARASMYDEMLDAYLGLESEAAHA